MGVDEEGQILWLEFGHSLAEEFFERPPLLPASCGFLYGEELNTPALKRTNARRLRFHLMLILFWSLVPKAVEIGCAGPSAAQYMICNYR